MPWRVRGQDSLIEGFRRVVRRGRLAHAYLFTGPVGVGKRLFAGELARALLCEKPVGLLDPCGNCPGCIQVDAGTHPDFYAAAKAAEDHEFKIEEMRKLCANFALKSARGRGRVVVVDGADDLNEESANCFLKTLEEPPPRSVLILIGTTPERQLPTILSRCQTVRFAPLPEPLMRELLSANEVTDPRMQERLVRLAGGSLGQAMTLANAELWEFRTRLIVGLTARPIDSVDLARAWTAFVETAGKETALQRQQAQVVLRLLIDFFADVLAVSLGGARRRTDNEDEKAVSELAGRCDAERTLGLLQRCLEADQQIEWRAQLVLILEALLDGLAQKM